MIYERNVFLFCCMSKSYKFSDSKEEKQAWE